MVVSIIEVEVTRGVVVVVVWTVVEELVEVVLRQGEMCESRLLLARQPAAQAAARQTHVVVVVTGRVVVFSI